MIDGLERIAQHEFEKSYAILAARERHVSKSEREYANQVRGQPGRNGSKPSNNGFAADVNEVAIDPQLLRRLKHTFVQEPTRRKVEKVTEWLPMGDGVAAFIRMVAVPVSLEGRITRRRHSHDRSWGEKYRPGWSVPVVDGPYVEDLHGAPGARDEFYGLQEMRARPATREDWENLQRVYADWEEPTLASKMPDEVLAIRNRKSLVQRAISFARSLVSYPFPR